MEIPFRETKLFPKIILDYLSGDDFLKPFYQYPLHIDSFEQAIAARSFPKARRMLLAEVLREQYQKIGVADISLTNQINSLENDNTYTVTTGHQLCIFTGPLFFLYKILTTIRLAEALKEKYPSCHFVPVYWLASEDHDFAEINHIHLNGRKISWNFSHHNEAVGTLPTRSLGAVLDEVSDLLAGNSGALAMLGVFREAYLESDNLSTATQKIAHNLFSKYGLLAIDPDDPRLKAQFTDVMQQDILNGRSYETLTASNKKLEQRYKTQVNGRDINFFYLSDEGRNLLRREGDSYVVMGTEKVFTTEQMKDEMTSHPARFSPNVVLRPVYQEMILPNLAVIGGPGEMAYWLQLKSTFDNLGVPFPVLWPRNSFLLLTSRNLKTIEKLGLTVTDLFDNRETLTGKAVRGISGIDTFSYESAADQALQALVDELMPFDNQLASSVIRHKAASAAFFGQLRKSINKRSKEKGEKDLEKMRILAEVASPGGSPQERVHNILQYAADPGFVDKIYRESSVIPALHVVTLDA